MRIQLNESKCDCVGTKKCLKNCPNNLEINALNCIHCNPKKAPCALACKRNAFFEISNGILSIDESLCNGCLECIESCPKKALCLGTGEKASKCDLCAKNGFILDCIEHCENNAIKLKQSEIETKKIRKILGWEIKNPEKKLLAKKLKEENEFEIWELKDNSKKYIAKFFPELSLFEAELFQKVLKKFQENERFNKKVSTKEFLKKYCVENEISLEEGQKQYFEKILEIEVFGSGGSLTPILEDENIEEICCIGAKRPLYVYHRIFGWAETNFYYTNRSTIKNLVNRMARKLGRRLSIQNPRLNACLENGCRINASIPPISFFGPNFTIRKFREKPFTPSDLIENKTVSSKAMAFLWIAMEIDCSILFVGNTGSGKTSTMNALFSFVPMNERIIAVEETPEIFLPHKHFVKLNVAEEMEIGMHELIFDTLRMRPDRIVVGEVRTPNETKAFIDTLLAGQGKGSYATFHGKSAKEAINRLEKFGASKTDLHSIDLIVVQKRWTKIDSEKGNRTELRKVFEITELLESENCIKQNKIFEFDFEKFGLAEKSISKKVFEKAKRCFGKNEKELLKELSARQKFLESCIGKNLEIREFFKKINNRQCEENDG